MIFLFLIGFFVLFSLLILTFAVLLDIIFIGHDFPSTKLATEQVSKILFKYKQEAGIFYDFGSCRGEFILGVKKSCPKLQALGIDSSGFRIWFSRLKAFLLQRSVQFIKANFFDINIAKADVVYVYLNQQGINAIEAKLKQELKIGAMVITNTQSFPNWPASETVITHINKPEYEKLFIYEKI